MNKRLIIASLLILTNIALFCAYQAPARQGHVAHQQRNNQAVQPQYNFFNGPTVAQPRVAAQDARVLNNEIVADEHAVNLVTLNQMQQTYAAQQTNDLKAQYINYVLDNTDQYRTIHQIIEQAQNLLKIVNNDISLHSGWFYNDDQTQIDWLKNQKAKITFKLSTLQWQTKHWTERALRNTLYGGGIVFAIILAAFLAQDQYKKLNPDYKIKTFGELSWMSVEQLINLAQAAVIPVQYAAKGAYQGGAMALAAGAAVKDRIYEAGEAIAVNGAARAQKDLHNLGKNLVKSTAPTPPSWSQIAYKYFNPKNVNPQKLQDDVQEGEEPGEDSGEDSGKEQDQTIKEAATPFIPRSEDQKFQVNSGGAGNQTKSLFAPPRKVTFMDWIDSPFQQWEHENKITEAAKWKVEYQEHQRGLAQSRWEEQLEEAEIMANAQIEYERLLKLGKPHPEQTVQNNIIKEQGKLNAKFAQKRADLDLQEQQLKVKMPEYVQKELQAAMKQQPNNKQKK